MLFTATRACLQFVYIWHGQPLENVDALFMPLQRLPLPLAAQPSYYGLWLSHPFLQPLTISYWSRSGVSVL